MSIKQKADMKTTGIDRDKVIATLHEYTREYAMTTNGSWLNDFDWISIPVDLKMFADPDVCGQYTFGVIFIMECGVPSVIFEIYVHELRHAWQKQKCLWKYLLGKIYRPLIENRAYEEQEKAGEWIRQRSDLVVKYESN